MNQLFSQESSSETKLQTALDYIIERLSIAPASENELARNARLRDIFSGIPRAVQMLRSEGRIVLLDGVYRLTQPIPSKTEGINTDLFSAVPSLMKELSRWVVWCYELRNGNPAKVPYQCHEGHFGNRAKTTSSATWTSFDDTIKCYLTDIENEVMGIGFMLGDGIIGFDFDNVRNASTGEIHPQAKKWLHILNGYAEVSPRCQGVKAINRGTLPTSFLGTSKTGRKLNGIPDEGMAIEAYYIKRFFTITGQCIDGQTELNENQQGIDQVCSEVLELKQKTEKSPHTYSTSYNNPSTIHRSDRDIINHIRRSRQANKFDKLWQGDISDYPSHSEADLALASIFMFWTGNNSQQTERIFSQSELAKRDKWQRDDYRKRTLDKARQSSVYQPNREAKNVMPEQLYLAKIKLNSAGMTPTDIDSSDSRGWILKGIKCPHHYDCIGTAIVYRTGKELYQCTSDPYFRNLDSLIGGKTWKIQK